MSLLLENAANSIRLGLEDFDTDEDDRLLSAARNLHAGLLLLYKEKLRRLSPTGSDEVLLKQNIEPIFDSAGNLTFVGKGRKTVDTQKIKERFKSLEISADWKSLDEVTKIRNEIEHYFTTAGKDAVREIISKSFILFRDFTRGELSEDPRDLLGEDAWLSMTDISEVYEQERKECEDAIENYEWTASELQDAALNTSCLECGSSLIEPINDPKRPDVRCRSCGKIQIFEEFAEHAMAEGIDHHSHIKDGGDSIVVICPNCSQETYHYELGMCVSCEESVDHDCDRCGSTIPPEELDYDSLCGYCRHMMSKDD
ncbi:MAG: hypothetical protein P1U58_18565 [Verrucomicrobiales bacterium]|nr:hypothetical protein [Verrucomicrobiales bacterium]